MRGRAQTTVTGDAETITALLHGDLAGVEAFLTDRIHIEGSLALALEMETLFGSGRHPRRWARAGHLKAAGIHTFYLDAGRPGAGRPPVVLIHGLGGTNASFLPTLWDLSRNHRVIAPDLPGHGDSGKPIRRYDATFYATWLTALLDELGIEKAHLVGNSLGGRISLEMGIVQAKRVASITLLAAAPVVHRLRGLVPVVRLLRPELSLVPLPMLRSHALYAVRSLFAHPGRVPQRWFEAAADEFVRVFREPGARVAFFSSLREIYLEEPLGRDGYWTRLRRVKAPTLMLWGDRDPLVPGRHAGAVRRALPHATSIMLRDCGHVPQYELPREVNRLIRRHLEEVEAFTSPGPASISDGMNRLPQIASARAAGAVRTA